MVLFNLENKSVHAFPKSINPKINITAWLEFELTNYNFAVQNVSHYATVTSPCLNGEQV